jgi:hypothetical protein
MQWNLDRGPDRNSTGVDAPKISQRLWVSADEVIRRATCCRGHRGAGKSERKNCCLQVNARESLILEELRINLINILLQTENV